MVSAMIGQPRAGLLQRQAWAIGSFTGWASLLRKQEAGSGQGYFPGLLHFSVWEMMMRVHLEVRAGHLGRSYIFGFSTCPGPDNDVCCFSSMR